MRQCENCHPEHRGKQAHITDFAYNNVNHELLSNFSLDLHQFDFDNQPMGCQSCHSQDSYVHERLDCITCHSSGDHDFTASHIKLYGSECISCHDGKDRYANFDHAAEYPLDGKHLDVACEECHQEKQFAGTPQECISCHEEPVVHAGIFGQDCGRCHAATAWYPAELTNHTFVVDHGVDIRPTCETCHKHTYTEYLCSSCHDPDEMKVIHLQEGIYDLHECIECHPSGSETAPSEIWVQKSETDMVEYGSSLGWIAFDGTQFAEIWGRMDLAYIEDMSGYKEVEKSNLYKELSNLSGGS